MRHFTYIAAVCLFSALLHPLAWAATDEITLAWDPNAETDLAGYRLYMQEGVDAQGYRLLVTIPVGEIDPDAPS